MGIVHLLLVVLVICLVLGALPLGTGGPYFGTGYYGGGGLGLIIVVLVILLLLGRV